jgi:formylglycine-generating enzyme required for sulfatase activity
MKKGGSSTTVVGAGIGVEVAGSLVPSSPQKAWFPNPKPYSRGNFMTTKTFIITAAAFLLIGLFMQAVPQSAAAQSVPKTEIPGMSLIPGGEFWMGRTHMFLFDELSWTARARLDDLPANVVHVDAFYMDKYELTNQDYARFVEVTGHTKPWHWAGGKINPGQEKWPVYNVSWDDAAAYCSWSGKRLPTEAEWEKAARGGLDRKLYPWGDQTGESKEGGSAEEGGRELKLAHYGFPNGPAPVGSYPPNGYGLFDVTGNVWEWVSDWYARDYYAAPPAKNPQGPDRGTYRVVRGGGWTNDSDELWRSGQRSLLGVHYRNYAPPSQTSFAFGFRCAKSVDASQKPDK